MRSLHATETRYHLHAFLEFWKAVDWEGLGQVVFMTTTPDARPTKARGNNHREVIDHGHFYCFANKLGTVYVSTHCKKEGQYRPWEQYTVQGWWLDKMWSSHKLTSQQYLAYAELVRVGFPTRQRAAEAVIASCTLYSHVSI